MIPLSTQSDKLDRDRISDTAVIEESDSDSRATTEQENGPLLSFFIPDLTVGGAEQVTVAIVNGLSERGYNVELLLSRSQGKLIPQLENHLEVVVLPPSKTTVLGVGANIPWLVSYLRRKKPAALFPHLCHVSVVSLAVCRLFDTDTLVFPTHHSALTSSRNQSSRDRLVKGLVPYLYPLADRIIAVSAGVADNLVDETRVSRESISVLHNPVDVESVRTRAKQSVDHKWIDDEDKDVILFVGRIADQKDLKTWLRAFEKVHERDPDTRAILVGQGPERGNITKFAEERGISDVVSLPGFVENPYGYMARSDVFLLSSRYEGLPTTLIEALACGCPIVATDCPSGPREILADGTYGPLIPVGDASGLADAVRETLAHPVPAEKLRGRADDFSPDAVFDDYERFIHTYVY